MAKTSFTVHLDMETANKVEQMREQNPTFSRNALIRLAISEYKIIKNDRTEHIDELYKLRMHINALHMQLNPDWKRKKSLPYHDPIAYLDIGNYTAFHGDGN